VAIAVAELAGAVAEAAAMPAEAAVSAPDGPIPAAVELAAVWMVLAV
jgi:hypothetical protein